VESLPALGSPISSLPIELTFVRDIEYFDGPILSEFVDPKGNPWVYKWADCDDNHHRWLVLPVTRTAIDQYLAMSINMCGFLNSCAGDCYLVDQNGTIDPSRAIESNWRQVSREELPEDYWPTESAMYDPNLAPPDQ